MEIPIARNPDEQKEQQQHEDSRPWQSYNTVYTNAKAGMDGVDKTKVQKIVYEMSKGSKYFENEQRKDAYIKQKIDNFQCQAALLTASNIANFEKVADRRMLELESARDLSKTWIHVDMDAFYAAVETLENPSLAGKPMAVGSMSMICTANYEARKFGVRAAMPGFIARKLCPDLIFVPTNFQKYSYYSDLTRKVFREYDSQFIARSLDEAYLNVTDVCKERCMTGEIVAEEIRSTVYVQTGLTCSAGVAPNRLLAKICSDINKPNGQFVLPNEQTAVIKFVSSLPIRKVNGIGKVTEHILRDALGIKICEDLLVKRALVVALFSEHTADFFLSVGLGLGGVEPPQAEHRKSISTERTFHATSNEVELFKKLDDIAVTLVRDMEKEGLCGRTLTLKLKTEAFEVRTRAVSLRSYIYSKSDILFHASKILRAELPISLRLMGLRISQFKDEKSGSSDPTQKTLLSYLSSRNAHQQGGRFENHSNVERDVYDSTEVDGRCSRGDTFGNDIRVPDTVDIQSTISLDMNYHPQDILNDVSHEPGIFKQDNFGEDTLVFESSISEIEDLGNIEDHLTKFCSSSNLMQAAYDGQLPPTRNNAPAALDKSECRSINTGRKKEFSSSYALHCLLAIEQSIKPSSSTVEQDNYDKNISLAGEQQCGSDQNQAKVDSLSRFSDVMFWVDDFKCSLCGFELPKVFIKERQEHFDYHLAQMLQQEDSPLMTAEQLNRKHIKNLRRPGDLLSHGREYMDKKQKKSKSKAKHVPIDSFFSKDTHLL